MAVQRISNTLGILTLVGLISFSGSIVAPNAVAKDMGACRVSQCGKEDESIKGRISEFSDALNKGDAKAEAALWSEDGTFVDESGKEWKGRTALEDRFASIFTENGKQATDLSVERIKMLSGTVAQAEGMVREQQDKSEAVPTTRFSILLVKQNGQWMISSATEMPIIGQNNSNGLPALDWLIGEWSTERNGKRVDMKYEWIAGKKFIHCTYGVSGANEPENAEVQIIGYDPRSRQIISWNFDANGGFGHSTWYKKDNQWMIDATKIGGDGSMSRSTHVLSMSDPNSFGWQSIGRTVDGVAVADTAQLKIQRVMKGQSPMDASVKP